MHADPQIVVATVTWARTRDEADRLVAALDVLREIGLPIVVADRGNDPAFVDRLAALEGLDVAVARSQGLVSQVQDALGRAAARDRRFILYTESDKQLFFERGLQDFLTRAPLDDDAGVVLAARSGSSFATFPPTQRRTESVFNELAAEQVGAVGDYCYGPFLMHSSLAPAVASLPPDLGWGWRPAIFMAARAAGRGVVHIEGDFDCPSDQRGEDPSERAHRIRQLSQNLLGLL